MEELFKEFKKEMKGSYIKAEDTGVKINGNVAALLTLYAHITESLSKCEYITRDDLKDAFEMGLMTNEEVNEKLKEEVQKLNGETIKELKVLKDLLKTMEDITGVADKDE